MLQLATSDKYLCVNEWQGATRIHIRNYFKNDNSQLIPTKKGIALTVEEWQELKMYISEIDVQVALLENSRSTETPWEVPPRRPKSLIPEECQAKPPSAEAISKQLLPIRNTTTYPRLREPEPFDQ